MEATTIEILHLLALEDADAAVTGLRTEDWDRPSRCVEWTERDLVRHMTGQNHGFARAISLGDAPLEAFRPLPESGWAASVAELRTALKAPVSAVHLAEVRGGSTWPLRSALGMHLVDCTVHAWDLLGDDYRPSDPLAEAVLAIALQIPAERPDGGPFGPVLAGDRSDPWQRALRLLGRDPAATGS